jgi:phosphatidylserine decarboxylase
MRPFRGIDKRNGFPENPRMQIRPEVIPFLLAGLILSGLILVLCRALTCNWAKSFVTAGLILIVFNGYMLYFFRNPARVPPRDPTAIVAGADGTVASITMLQEKQFLHTNAVRISIFLSLFDVHVNRAPISGTVKFLHYYPGTRYFTFQEKSSEFNQHNSILIEGETTCLVNQIVGPVARRVVHWLQLEQKVEKGDPIGMMKFGSRLDMYFPADDVVVTAQKGQKVHAGETVIANLKRKVSE